MGWILFLWIIIFPINQFNHISMELDTIHISMGLDTNHISMELDGNMLDPTTHIQGSIIDQANFEELTFTIEPNYTYKQDKEIFWNGINDVIYGTAAEKKNIFKSSEYQLQQLQQELDKKSNEQDNLNEEIGKIDTKVGSLKEKIKDLHGSIFLQNFVTQKDYERFYSNGNPKKYQISSSLVEQSIKEMNNYFQQLKRPEELSKALIISQEIEKINGVVRKIDGQLEQLKQSSIPKEIGQKDLLQYFETVELLNGIQQDYEKINQLLRAFFSGEDLSNIYNPTNGFEELRSVYDHQRQINKNKHDKDILKLTISKEIIESAIRESNKNINALQYEKSEISEKIESLKEEIERIKKQVEIQRKNYQRIKDEQSFDQPLNDVDMESNHSHLSQFDQEAASNIKQQDLLLKTLKIVEDNLEKEENSIQESENKKGLIEQNISEKKKIYNKLDQDQIVVQNQIIGEIELLLRQENTWNNFILNKPQEIRNFVQGSEEAFNQNWFQQKSIVQETNNNIDSLKSNKLVLKEQLIPVKTSIEKIAIDIEQLEETKNEAKNDLKIIEQAIINIKPLKKKTILNSKNAIQLKQILKTLDEDLKEESTKDLQETIILINEDNIGDYVDIILLDGKRYTVEQLEIQYPSNNNIKQELLEKINSENQSFDNTLNISMKVKTTNKKTNRNDNTLWNWNRNNLELLSSEGESGNNLSSSKSIKENSSSSMNNGSNGSLKSIDEKKKKRIMVIDSAINYPEEASDKKSEDGFTNYGERHSDHGAEETTLRISLRTKIQLGQMNLGFNHRIESSDKESEEQHNNGLRLDSYDGESQTSQLRNKKQLDQMKERGFNNGQEYKQTHESDAIGLKPSASEDGSSVSSKSSQMGTIRTIDSKNLPFGNITQDKTIDGSTKSSVHNHHSMDQTIESVVIYCVKKKLSKTIELAKENTLLLGTGNEDSQKKRKNNHRHKDCKRQPFNPLENDSVRDSSTTVKVGVLLGQDDGSDGESNNTSGLHRQTIDDQSSDNSSTTHKNSTKIKGNIVENVVNDNDFNNDDAMIIAQYDPSLAKEDGAENDNQTIDGDERSHWVDGVIDHNESYQLEGDGKKNEIIEEKVNTDKTVEPNWGFQPLTLPESQQIEGKQNEQLDIHGAQEREEQKNQSSADNYKYLRVVVEPVRKRFQFVTRERNLENDLMATAKKPETTDKTSENSMEFPLVTIPFAVEVDNDEQKEEEPVAHQNPLYIETKQPYIGQSRIGQPIQNIPIQKKSRSSGPKPRLFSQQSKQGVVSNPTRAFTTKTKTLSEAFPEKTTITIDGGTPSTNGSHRGQQTPSTWDPSSKINWYTNDYDGLPLWLKIWLNDLKKKLLGPSSPIEKCLFLLKKKLINGPRLEPLTYEKISCNTDLLGENVEGAPANINPTIDQKK